MTTLIAERVRRRLADAQEAASVSSVAKALRDEGVVVGDAGILELADTLRRELTGAGPLEPLLADDAVTDVLVNAPEEVWVDRGTGMERASVRFTDEAQVRAVATRLAARAGRRLDDAAPFVDAMLEDGTRVHAVLPPIATDGTTISLRVPRRAGFTIDGLVDAGALDDRGADVLRALIAARIAFLVTGGTGSGKTAVLGAMLGEVAPHERIVIVEDAAELRPRHPHVVRMQARLPNIEGHGQVTLRDLVRQSLRMRPDRLVVGEVRGAEIIDLLSALNTGHEGGCATMHANSARDVPARLEALGLMAGVDRPAIHALCSAGIDAIVHLIRDAAGRRRVEGVHCVLARADGLVHTVPALSLHGHALEPGPGFDALLERLPSHISERLAR